MQIETLIIEAIAYAKDLIESRAYDCFVDSEPIYNIIEAGIPNTPVVIDADGVVLYKHPGSV